MTKERAVELLRDKLCVNSENAWQEKDGSQRVHIIKDVVHPNIIDIEHAEFYPTEIKENNVVMAETKGILKQPTWIRTYYYKEGKDLVIRFGDVKRIRPGYDLDSANYWITIWTSAGKSICHVQNIRNENEIDLYASALLTLCPNIE